MPRRSKVTKTKSSKAPADRRSTRSRARDDPAVYNDILAEVAREHPEEFAESPRPKKRQRTQEPRSGRGKQNHDVVSRDEAEVIDLPDRRNHVDSDYDSELDLAPSRSQQIVLNDFDQSDDENDDDDVEFEDVQIGDTDNVSNALSTSNGDVAAESSADPKSLTLNLNTSQMPAKKSVQRRRPVTKSDRLHRLNVHKWHLMCLLLHMSYRNRWCDDERVQAVLKPLIPKKLIALLHTSESRGQAERNFGFQKAILEIMEIWKDHWKITTRGIKRAYWRDGDIDMERELDEAEEGVDLEGFREAAKEMSASRDVGAQLFCALLRSVAVETRLVCSLQVLPFSAQAAGKGETAQKAGNTTSYIQAVTQNFGNGTGGSSTRRKKKFVESAFPIWWVEVYNPALSSWLPVDAITRHTYNKPRTGFEPPASDGLNAMNYVVAFEDDGSARDVTRRYAEWYIAKTRKTRVESTKDGQRWMDQTMKRFKKSHRLPRDDIEDAEFDKRSAREGMPKNVQDFKDHPVYVLEQHLRSNEVIEPRRECGKFSVGSGEKAVIRDVFRRQDVHLCRSADAWYRRGRDIAPGQQPLKYATNRSARTDAAQAEADPEIDHDESTGVSLYAEFQTTLYTPPPVTDGKVPRNQFGNLDIYVPSMIPAGAVHINHPLARQAAKILKIDAVDAITGFTFKGRQGTAIVNGIVIVASSTAALLSTVSSLEEGLIEEAKRQRESVIGDVWRKMHASLIIRERLQAEYGDRDGDDQDNTSRGLNNDMNSVDEDDDDEDGGFVPSDGEHEAEIKARDTAMLKTLREKAPITLPPLVVKVAPVVVRSPHMPESEIDAQKKKLSLLKQGSTYEMFGSEIDEDEYQTQGQAGGFLVGDEDSIDGKDNDQGTTHGANGRVEAETGDDGAGGFFPEDADAMNDDHDTGGGFLPDNDQSDQAFDQSKHDESEVSGGGFLLEDEDTILPPEPTNTPFKAPGLSMDSEAAANGARRTASMLRHSDGDDDEDKTVAALPIEEIKSSVDKSQAEDEFKQERISAHPGLSKNVSAMSIDSLSSHPSLLSEDPDADEMDTQGIEDAFDDDQ